MWNVFYRFETIKESFLWSCCCIQVTCVWGTFDIWVIGLNPTTSKTRPTFESLRELRLIYNREMFLCWDGLESTPRKASQAEEVALLYFLCTWCVCVCECGRVGRGVLQVGQGLAWVGTDMKRAKAPLWPGTRSGSWTLSPALPPLCGSWRLSPGQTARFPGAHTSLSDLQTHNRDMLQ